MSSKKLYEIISDVMNVPVTEINDQSDPESIEKWDSFSGYLLLNEIESKFNVKFTLDDALNIKNIGDFKRILSKQGISFVE